MDQKKIDWNNSKSNRYNNSINSADDLYGRGVFVMVQTQSLKSRLQRMVQMKTEKNEANNIKY